MCMGSIFTSALNVSVLLPFSIITQVIIEIRALPLAENGVIFRYNHLRKGEYSGRTNFLNLMKRKCHSEEYETRHKVRNDTLQR